MTTKGELKVSGMRAIGRDCLIHQESANEFLMGIARYEATSKAEIGELEANARESLEIAYGYDDDDVEQPSKPFVYRDGIAVIPVHGTLINRFNGSWGFVTGYNYIRRQMNLAAYDDDVEVIVLDIDSPGGEAAGNFELCREIMELRSDKPILGVVDSRCMSGGYSIGASCTQLHAIPSAAVGSIGAYRMHMDVSKMMENDGVKVTFAKAGEHKTDGNPFEPLPESVLKEWEEGARRTWDDFISVVAEGRKLSPEEVRSTQARVFRADEALALGLIDAVKTPTEAVAAFVAELAEDEPYSEDEDMAGQTPKAAGTEATSAPQIDNAAISAAAAAAVAEDRRVQRQRRAAVLTSDEGKANVKMATSLLDNSDLDANEIKAILIEGAEPEEKPEPAPEPKPGEGEEKPDDKEAAKGKQPVDTVNHLATAMGGSKQPEIGAGGEQGSGDGTGEKTDAEMAAGILGAQAIASGRKLEKVA